MQTIPLRHIKPAIKEPDASGDLMTWDLSSLLSGKDMVQELHRHSFYFILAIEKGTGEHVIDFTPYPVTDRSFYIMRPGQVHELRLRSNCKGYLLQFADQFHLSGNAAARQMLKKVRRKNHYLLAADATERMLSIIERIHQETREKKDKYGYAIELHLQLLLLEMTRHADGLIDIANEKTSYQADRLEEFRELVAEHVAAQKQVQWYAQKMHLTTYQLNSITKSLLGESSSKLIDDHILLEAKRYLLATANQVNEIAWHLGYEDVSYFIRFFKKHTGYSPEAFRKHFT